MRFRAVPVGPIGCVGFELMHRRKVMPSLMWRPNLTQTTRKNSANNTKNCVGACPSYGFLADAAGPTIDTSSRSVTHVYLFNRLVALTEMRMSAIGTKRTCRVALHMSAFGVRADMPFCIANVRFWPKSRISRVAK